MDKHLAKRLLEIQARVIYGILFENNNDFSISFKNYLTRKILSGEHLQVMLPWQIQQAIDTSASGGLNYLGITTLRDTLERTFPDERAEDDCHIAYHKNVRKKGGNC